MSQSKQQSSQNLTQKKPSTEERAVKQTFRDHLYEVRKRLFWIVAVLIATSLVGLQLKDQVTAAIMQPLHGEKLIYLTPGGGFSFIFTVSLYFGVLFTIPVAVYHLFKFLQPIIGKTSRRFVAGFLCVSTLLAIGGALFGYYVTIPAALSFLANFGGDAVTANLTADSYLSFVVTYILGLALVFQLPLLLFIFDHVSPMKPGFLSSTQNYVIIGATVLAAVITPTPDAFNMAVVAVPIIAVYEVGAMAVLFRRHLRNRAAATVAVPRLHQELAKIDDEPLAAIIDELRQRAVERQSEPVVEPVVEPEHVAESEVDSIDLIELVEASEPIKSPEPAEVVEVVEPTELAEQVETTEQVELAEPVQLAEVTESAESTEPAVATEPTKAAEPAVTRRVVDSFIKPVATSAPTLAAPEPVSVAQQPVVRPRMVDGFSARSPQPRAVVVPPARSGVLTPTITERVAQQSTDKPTRSIDGIVAGQAKLATV